MLPALAQQPGGGSAVPFRLRPLGACTLPGDKLTAEGSIWVEEHHRVSPKMN